jgi:hypothetical protein
MATLIVIPLRSKRYPITAITLGRSMPYTCCTASVTRYIRGMSIHDIATRIEALLHARTRRKLLLAAAVSGVIAVLQIFVSDWMDANVWEPLKTGLRVLRDEPIGYGGLVLLVVLVLSILIALIDTSPTAAVLREWRHEREGKRRPLTAVELNENEAVRQTWIGEPQQACESVIMLLNSAVTCFSNRGDPFVGLLGGPIEKLRVAVRQLDEALAPAASQSPAVVQSRLGDVVEAYRTGAAWINRSLRYDPEWLSDPQVFSGKEKYELWLRQHAVFAGGVSTLVKRSSFQGFDHGLEDEPRQILLTSDRFGDFRPAARRSGSTPSPESAQ